MLYLGKIKDVKRHVNQLRCFYVLVSSHYSSTSSSQLIEAGNDSDWFDKNGTDAFENSTNNESTQEIVNRQTGPDFISNKKNSDLNISKCFIPMSSPIPST